MKQDFKTQTEDWRTVIPGRQETNEESPTVTQLTTRKSFQAWVREGGASAEPDDLTELRRHSWESRETKEARVHKRISDRRELHEERNPENCRESPLSSLAEYWRAHVCEETTQI